MSRHDRYISEAQAEALVQRDRPYTSASEMSFTVAFDYHNREPKDLREATRMVRAAYADEVPMRLHEGPDSIGEGGTPKMDARAEGYLFGHDQAGHERPDPETGERPAMDYYRTPFRAALDHWQHKDPQLAAFVSHVALGGQGPIQAAMTEGAPRWCARDAAEGALRRFLRSLSDVKVDVAKRPEVA